MVSTAALCGAVAAVWALSYVAEERFSLRRVRGSPQGPHETTLELYWSRGGVCAYHRTRIGDDELFAYARHHLGRGWFYYRPDQSLSPTFNYAGSLDRYPPLGFAAGRSRSDPDGPIEWRARRRRAVLVPNPNVRRAARWPGGGGHGSAAAPSAWCVAAGFLTAFTPLATFGAARAENFQRATPPLPRDENRGRNP